MESQEVLKSLFSVLFPEEISSHFEIKSVEEYKGRIEIRLEELPELIPQELISGKDIILDGFCNPLELQSFPLKGKPVYLKLYRRSRKESGKKKHFSNHYNFHTEGVKATKDFAAFLKDAFGHTPNQYNDNLKDLMR